MLMNPRSSRHPCQGAEERGTHRSGVERLPPGSEEHGQHQRVQGLRAGGG